jgi:hypothetical protein
LLVYQRLRARAMNWRLKLLVGLIKPQKNTIESELVSSISSRVVEMFGVRDGQKTLRNW